jgi:hypothetical protein
MSDLGTDTASERRRWGRFYTPPAWADLTLRLCLRDAADRVLDPSCGDGVFLARAAAYKQRLDPSRDAATLSQELWGVEVDRAAADQAAQNLGLAAHIICADFFSLGAGELPMFDCVVGNPPYTRQEWLQELAPGGDKSALIHRALGQRSLRGRRGLVNAARRNPRLFFRSRGALCARGRAAGVHRLQLVAGRGLWHGPASVLSQ